MNVRPGGFMMRRYLIVNGVSTAVMYAGVWAFVPSVTSLTQTLNQTWDTYVMGDTILGPVLYRMITVGASLLGAG